MTSLDSSFIIVDDERDLPTLSLPEVNQTLTEIKSEPVGDSTTLCAIPEVDYFSISQYICLSRIHLIYPVLLHLMHMIGRIKVLWGDYARKAVISLMLMAECVA